MQLEALLGEWRDWLTAAGQRPATIELRMYQVARVLLNVDVDPADVSTSDLLHWLAAQEWRPNTRRAFRGALRAFYRWMEQVGYVDRSPATALPPVKVPRSRPRPFPEPEYVALVNRPLPAQLRLAVILAGSCGLRRAEIAGVHREHFQHTTAGLVLHVVGKGGHERFVPVPSDVAILVPAAYLFEAKDGGHMTPGHVGKVIAGLLPDDWTTHSLRHRTGYATYAASRDLRAVQELLGHAKPETTALYTRVDDASIRSAVEAAHPVAGIACRPLDRDLAAS